MQSGKSGKGGNNSKDKDKDKGKEDEKQEKKTKPRNKKECPACRVLHTNPDMHFGVNASASKNKPQNYPEKHRRKLKKAPEEPILHDYTKPTTKTPEGTPILLYRKDAKGFYALFEQPVVREMMKVFKITNSKQKALKAAREMQAELDKEHGVEAEEQEDAEMEIEEGDTEEGDSDAQETKAPKPDPKTQTKPLKQTEEDEEDEPMNLWSALETITTFQYGESTTTFGDDVYQVS